MTRDPGKDTHGQPDPALLELLVCPLTRTTLQYDAENDELVSRVANLAYPVREGIPVMIVSEARELDPTDPETA